jgi:hypothetical protein
VGTARSDVRERDCAASPRPRLTFETKRQKERKGKEKKRMNGKRRAKPPTKLRCLYPLGGRVKESTR